MTKPLIGLNSKPTTNGRAYNLTMHLHTNTRLYSKVKTKTLGIQNLTALTSGRTAIDPGPMRKGLNSCLP